MQIKVKSSKITKKDSPEAPMAPQNPLGEQILGKETIFGDFGALFGGQNAPKINQKAREKTHGKKVSFPEPLVE